MKTVNEGKKCYYSVNEAGVALMEINNPPMNALSRPTLADMHDSFTKALADDDVRVIVFTGAGKAFIAGADISEFNAFTTAQEGADFLIPGQEMTNLLQNADKPIIAAVNGFCLGGGNEMAIACHIQIADESAMFGFPEIKLGIIPGYGGTQRAARRIGTARALELILTGNFLNGKQAEQYGLVNRAVAKGTAVEEAMKLATTMASKSRISIQAALRVVNVGVTMDLHTAMRYERDLFGVCSASEDKKEGAAAFMEKREPNFKDR